MARKINKQNILSQITKNAQHLSPKTLQHLYLECTLNELRNGTITSSHDLYTLFSKELEKVKQGNNILLTLPEFINTMLKVGTDHRYWNKDYNFVTYSEENYGTDTHGKFTKKDEQVVVVIHGKGLISQAKLETAQNKDTMIKPIEHTQEEFDTLLSGKNILEKPIKLYHYDEIVSNTSYHNNENLRNQYGIVIPFKLISSCHEQFYTDGKWMQDPLAISRCGAQYNDMQQWLQIALTSCGAHGCFHKYEFYTYTKPIGQLLSISPLSGIFSQSFSCNEKYTYSFISIVK